MAFFLTKSISLEPSVNYAFNTYTQEQEVYVGDTGDPSYNPIYDDQDRKTSTNAFYFRIAASNVFLKVSTIKGKEPIGSFFYASSTPL